MRCKILTLFFEMSNPTGIRSLIVAVLITAVVLCVIGAEEGGLPIQPLPRFTCNPYEVRPDEPRPTNVNQ